MLNYEDFELDARPASVTYHREGSRWIAEKLDHRGDITGWTQDYASYDDLVADVETGRVDWSLPF